MKPEPLSIEEALEEALFRIVQLVEIVSQLVERVEALEGP